MNETPAPGTSSGRREVVAARTEAPAMPRPAAATLWRDTPHLIVGSGQRYSLGWMDTRKEGPRYVIARIGVMGAKVLDRFPLTADGWAQAWAALLKLDVGAAEAVASRLKQLRAAAAAKHGEPQRQAQVFAAFANAGSATEFRWLGVQVLLTAGEVYTIGSQDPYLEINTSQLLGPLAGAQALVTDGSQAWSPGRAMFLPISLAGLATKTKADAAVVFPDGTVQTVPLDGNHAVREAQKQVLQFNALADAAAAPESAEPANDPAARLRTLRELLDAGLVTQAEYDAKRAEIINSI